MLLVVLLTGLISALTLNNVILQTSAAEPGYLDFDNLPETNFSCEGKVIGGYYADTETGCQMFHVCTIGQKDIKFLCLNGTVFDQETRVCERLDEVDCSKSESYYDLNLELYGNNGASYGIHPENEEEPVSNDNDEDKCINDEEDCKTEPQPNEPNNEDEYDDIEEHPDPTPPTTSTSSTSRPTTTPTPPQITYPTSSPETIAALLALHNAFQESLKEHERPSSSSRLPGTIPSPVPISLKPIIQNVFNKERAQPSRFSSPVSFSTSQRPISFVLNGQNFPPNQANSQQSQISNHHFPAPAPQPSKQPTLPFNLLKPKPVNSFTSTVRTSQPFGNSNFQQTFQQQNAGKDENISANDDEEYSEEDYPQSQSSTTRPFAYNPYNFNNQNRFSIGHEQADTHEDVKRTPSSSSSFLLQQLKLRFNDNPPIKHPGAHGFTRAISDHQTKVLNFPEKPSQSTTLPPVSVVLSKSSTSSVVRSVSSKFNQSAISHPQPANLNAQTIVNNASKPVNPTTIKPVPKSVSPTAIVSQGAPHDEDYREEYDDYLEDELGPDLFYKDVQKLERQKRQAEFLEKGIIDHNTFDKRKEIQLIEKVLSKVFKEIENKNIDHRYIISNKNNKKITSSVNLPKFSRKHEEKRTKWHKSEENTIPKYILSQLSDINNSTVLDEINRPLYTVPNSIYSSNNDNLNNRKLLEETDLIDIKDFINVVELNANVRGVLLNLNETSDWFKNDSIYYSLDHSTSSSMCTAGKELYNNFNTNENLSFELENISSLHKTHILLGKRNRKLCRQLELSSRRNVKKTLMFLIETKYLFNLEEYSKLKRKNIHPNVNSNSIINLIELKSRIKILLLKRKQKTFKLLKEINTSMNPVIVISAIEHEINTKHRNHIESPQY